MYCFFFQGYDDHRYLHVLTHSFPTRRSSDLLGHLSLQASGTNRRIAPHSAEQRQVVGCRGLAGRGDRHRAVLETYLEEPAIGDLIPAVVSPPKAPAFAVAGWRQPEPLGQIGRASCRERVCEYVWISVVAV